MFGSDSMYKFSPSLQKYTEVVTGGVRVNLKQEHHLSLLEITIKNFIVNSEGLESDLLTDVHLNLLLDLRHEQTQQKEESGKL